MFEDDLKEGKRVEREFAKRLLNRWLLSLEFSDWQCKERDVKVRFKRQWVDFTKLFEIKNDKVSPTSWNVWFEYRCNWTPSWVYASKADYIVYYINDTFYYQDRAELLILLNWVPKIEVAWWDWNRSDMYLVSNIYLDKLFKKL